MLEILPHPLVLLLGLAMGVLIAAPVGPVNIICIQRSIERGAIAGIMAGLGAVLGDGLIALLAALGVGQVTSVIARHRNLIQTIGGGLVILFGLRLAFMQPRLSDSVAPRQTAFDIPQTFVLTVSNPGAVLGTFALFGIVSTFVDVASTSQALWLVVFIAAGSLGWWVFLATMVARVRHRLGEARIAQINAAAGWLMIFFGVVLILEPILKP